MRITADPRKILASLRRITWREKGVLRRFARHRGGAVVMVFALTLIPILGFIGGAIDYANAYRTRSKLQAALDSATLAAGRVLDEGASESRAQEVANQVMAANLGQDFPDYTTTLNIGDQGKTIKGSAASSVGTHLLGLVGHQTLPVAVNSEVTLSGGKFEVVMVLDNSGSMGGSKIRDLKKAAKKLTQTLFKANRREGEVMIGVVPFAPSVNVGRHNANAPWMDRTGVSSIHYENFDDQEHTRWELFGQMRSTRWEGCVEVRPSPHDVNDTSPSPGDGDSYFVPLFAPDEPDDGRGYGNSYIDDDGGSCSGGEEDSRRGGRGRGRGRGGRDDDDDDDRGGGGDESEVAAQEKTCKYDGARPTGWNDGPNYMCDSREIQPLTTNQGHVISSIENMDAGGMTNIMEGVMWGWRVLSPNAPFTEGRSYDDPENRKFMIVMTDGANTHTGRRNQNMSNYSAFGYAKHGRLRAPTSSTRLLVEAMNEKTLQACNNAKGENIFVYTIAFDVNDSETRALLRQCASDTSRAFTIENGDALIAVFEAIATEINRLRISS